MSLFRLCRLLKIWDVDGLLKKMPLKLFLEWEAFFMVEEEIRQKADLQAEASRNERMIRAKHDANRMKR